MRRLQHSEKYIRLLLTALLAALLCAAVSAEAEEQDGGAADPTARGGFAPVCRLHVPETLWGIPIPAETLRGYIEYEGALALCYLKEPDWEKNGYQAAALLLENEAGQRYVQPFAVLVRADTEPPVLYGVHKLYGYIDEPVPYLAGVWATDNADGAPVITVDDSAVHADRVGKYRIVYTAADQSGNRVTAATEVMLLSSRYTADYVHELADEVLGEITVPGMTRTEKLRAVYDWCKNTIHYGYGAGDRDWRKAAVQGFAKHAGDCFGYYSCARALLDEIGVEYISLYRLGGTTRHYWLLVNVGTGWYHFDATPAQHKLDCFMWTDGQCRVKPRFWKYDHTLFPDTATEPFDYEAQVAQERAGTAAGLPENKN